jgi:hypothetical protein
LITADEAEMKAIEEVRKLGKEVMHEWADHQHKKQIEIFESQTRARKHIKKNFIGKQYLEE